MFDRKMFHYAVVTGSYWGFTLTDGALRMLVLLYFHQLGYSPFEIAALFFLYELLGMVTNLLGSWIGARLGIRTILRAGLMMQIAALTLLSFLSTQWDQWFQVTYVVTTQGISGVAKDLVKVGAKSAIKILVPEHANTTLFRWVTFLTGSKNALKGIGFFLGGLLLTLMGFRHSLWILAGGLLGFTLLASVALPKRLGRMDTKISFYSVFAKDRAINLLSMARMFLFCARDVWFVVAVPVFFAEVLGWGFVDIATYLAIWVLGYGFVQAVTPKIVRHRTRPTGAPIAGFWGITLATIPLLISLSLYTGVPSQWVVPIGLAIFGIVFAINSATHSFLILAYANKDKVLLQVGFYYMANAGGRLIGSLLSGILYQLGGLLITLVASSTLALFAGVIALTVPKLRS